MLLLLEDLSMSAAFALLCTLAFEGDMAVQVRTKIIETRAVAILHPSNLWIEFLNWILWIEKPGIFLLCNMVQCCHIWQETLSLFMSWGNQTYVPNSKKPHFANSASRKLHWESTSDVWNQFSIECSLPYQTVLHKTCVGYAILSVCLCVYVCPWKTELNL